jgi:hypothetical protein
MGSPGSRRSRLAFALALCAGLLAAPGAQSSSFHLDDNPAAPIAGPPGPIPGFGAEDPFGLVGPALAPSPSVTTGGGDDASILAPGPALQHLGPNGAYMDSLSTNHASNGKPIWISFSVDRASVGAAASAVAGRSALFKQPGDIYTTTDLYADPGAFAGTLGAGPFAGVLAAPLGGAASNTLTLDGVAALGLTEPNAAIAGGTHDNVDGFDFSFIDVAPADANFDVDSYFTVYPDEAVGLGFSSADIFDVAAGAVGNPLAAYALAGTMGLDTLGVRTDSIDALIVFDNDLIGGPGFEGPGAQSGVDYALFSLAPGSASLVAGAVTPGGLSSSDVFFTDFSGAFALYAGSPSLGLVPAAGGTPFGGDDNIDALELEQVPEPSTHLLLAIGLGLTALGRGRSRDCRPPRRSARSRST